MGKKRTLVRKFDRLSDLPDNVIDNIVKFLPLQSAVKTSVLSTKWRFNWTRKENLVLDRDFFLNLDYFVLDQVSDYMSVVTNVLLSHNGCIHEFHLFVPCFSFTSGLVNAINMWLISVLRRGVQDLRLELEEYNDNNHHQVPCSLFQFSELKHLSLRGVRPPSYNFKGVSSVLSLELYCGNLPRDYLSNLIMKCPLLEKISFLVDHAIDPLVIISSKFKILCIENRYGSGIVVKYIPNLSTISLKLRSNGAVDFANNCQDIISFFTAVPKIEDVTVTGDILMVWAKLNLPERLPVPLPKCMSLTLCDLNLYSEDQIRSLACLLNSSPKLHTLNISFLERIFGDQQLLPQMREMENLNNLRIAKVSNIHGYKREMILIKMILSRSAVLEKLYLISNPYVNFEVEFKMMTDFMRLRRASTQAEIIFIYSIKSSSEYYSDRRG